MLKLLIKHFHFVLYDLIFCFVLLKCATLNESGEYNVAQKRDSVAKNVNYTQNYSKLMSEARKSGENSDSSDDDLHNFVVILKEESFSMTEANLCVRILDRVIFSDVNGEQHVVQQSIDQQIDSKFAEMKSELTTLSNAIRFCVMEANSRGMQKLLFVSLLGLLGVIL